MKTKMNWLVDAYKSGKLNYKIHNTGEKKGTIVMPTGYGKSGVVYEDILWHIDHAEPGEKIVFNLSAPILKLEAQFVNDLFSVLKAIPKYKEMFDRGEFEFYVNSSADGDAYVECDEILDVNRFADIEGFKNDWGCFAIVASCHKSLPKFAQKVEELNSFATVINYIDEAHLVANEVSKDSIYDKLSAGDKVLFDNFTHICQNSDYLYALTATPDAYITETINHAKGYMASDADVKFIINVYARTAREENIILPVNIQFAKVSDGDDVYKITPQICDSFMKTVKKDNDKIHHKILVTCSNTNHLIELQTKLDEMGYNTFSTCAKHGGKSTIDGDSENVDPIEFINKVDSYDGDCFVLHIKQLIQGIDIKSLTDAIYYNSCALDNKQKRRLIQTIGRILRPAAGERGMEEKDRTKKHGNVLLLIKSEAFDTISDEMSKFLLLYFGRDGVKAFKYRTSTSVDRKEGAGSGIFHFGTGLDGDYFDFYEDAISELKVNVDNYIRTQILPFYKMCRVYATKGKFKKTYIPRIYAEMRRTYSKCDGREYGLGEVLDDLGLMEAIEDLFNHYGID